MIGYDTVRAYKIGNYYNYIKLRINLQYVKRERHYVHKFNNCDIVFSFAHGTTSIRFSIPKLVFGDNMRVAGIQEAYKATRIMSDLIGLDFKQFRISRLHITSNIKSEYPPKRYARDLKRPAYFKGIESYSNNFYYHIHTDFKKSKRSILFYQKAKDCIRIEAKFENKHQMGGSIGSTIRHFLKHEPLISQIVKESCYMECVKYYLRTVGTTLNGKIKSEEDRQFKLEFANQLRQNYTNTLNHLYLNW